MPYHESTIELRQIIQSDEKLQRIPFFPVKRVAAPNSFNYLIEPLQRERIGHWLSRTSQATSAPSVNLIVVDDASISGGTFSEIRLIIDDLVGNCSPPPIGGQVW